MQTTDTITYLDHAATSPMPEAVARRFVEAARTVGWNPSTPYRLGLAARKALDEARAGLAHALHCPQERIVLTSGGTESNNLGLAACCARYRAGGVLWHAATTHPSLAGPLAALPADWTRLTMPRTAWGAIDPAALESLPPPQVVVLEWVNNEIGFIQPVDAVVRAAHTRNPDVRVLVDGAQGFGKLPPPDLADIACFTASGHKLGAPVGIGLVVVEPGAPAAPLMLGGGQENGWRPGTEPVPLACAFAAALAHLQESAPPAFDFPALDDDAHPRPMRHPEGVYAPTITLLDLQPVEGEVLLHHLEERGIFLGAGSACSSRKKGLSAIHQAAGLTPRQSRCTLRWSTCPGQPEAELEAAWRRLVSTWRDLVPLFT